jgi:aromatic-L-amino-acid decarboxylase
MGARAGEIVAEYLGSLDRRGVSPPADPRALTAFFGERIAAEGVGWRRSFDELRETALATAMGIPHPLYLGLMNSSPWPAGIFAESLVAGFSQNAGSFRQSPPATAAEWAVTRFLCEKVGYGARSFGTLVPGGTLANLSALLCARDRAFPDWLEEGPAAAGGKRPCFYASEEAHFSIARSAGVLGLGRSSLHRVPTLGRGSIDPAALASLVGRDRAEGWTPFAVVATACTTATGAIDPIPEVAQVAAREGLWLHVDAAFGGAALLSERDRPLLAGIERADSVTIDPHKWFFVPLLAGALLVRDEADLERSFDADPSYVPATPGIVDYFRRTLQGSRRGDALKVWVALRSVGTASLARAIERTNDHARALERMLQARGFEVLPDGRMPIVDFRLRPAGVEGEALDAVQRDLQARLETWNRAWFATARFRGRLWLRANFASFLTTEDHVAELAAWLGKEADRLRAGRL